MKAILNRQVLDNIAFDKGYRVDEIAKYLHLSSRQFRYVFEKEIGISPKTWMKECRVRRAMNMIEEGIDLEKIYAKLHYSSANHLVNEVKEYAGMSPTEISLSYRLSRGKYL